MLPEVDRLDQHVDVGERGEDDADRVGADLARRLSSSRPVIFGMRWSVTTTATSSARASASASSPLLASRSLNAAPEVEPEGVEVVLLVVDDQHGKFREIQPLLRHATTVTQRSGRFAAARQRTGCGQGFRGDCPHHRRYASAA